MRPIRRSADRTIIIAVGLLLGLHPVAAYFYLPTLPMLREAFDVSPQAAQRTLAALLFGLGAGKLISGPLADRYGRRPVLLTGLALFTASSTVIATTAYFDLLLACRVVQGLGVAAAAVCARAMVRDLRDGDGGARLLSQGFSCLGIFALIGPPAAVLIATQAGFRASFWCVALIGVVTTLFAVRQIGETKPPDAADQSKRGDVAALLRSRHFLIYTSLITTSHAGHFAFLSASSFVLIEQFGLTSFTYSAALGVGAGHYFLGTILCRRWLRHGGIERTLWRASWISCTAGVALLAAAAYGIDTVWMLLLPAWLQIAANAIQQACGQAAVMRPFPERAATANAAAGFVLTITAAAIGAFLGGILAASPAHLAVGVAICTITTSLLGWFALPQASAASETDLSTASRAWLASSKECSRAA